MARDQLVNPADTSNDGAGGGLPTSIGFSTTIPFDKNGYMPQQTIAAVLAFTPGSGGKAGASVTARLVADGSHTPTFGGGFIEHSSSAGFDPTAGRINFVSFWFDGTTYLYSVSQGINMPLVGLPTVLLRFGANAGGDGTITEGGDGVSGWTYTGGLGTGWQQYCVSNKHFGASGDGSVQAKRHGESTHSGGTMLLLQDSSAPASYQSAAFGIYPAIGNGLYMQITNGAPGAATTLALAPLENDIMRLRRTGTTLFAEISQDNGSTWKIIHSWAGITLRAEYPNLCFAGEAGAVISNLGYTGLV